jgi:membrane associated rhomboid family serine protease
MFIPIRTDRPPKRTPIVTQAIVVANLAVYLAGAAGAWFGLLANPQRLAEIASFDPAHFRAWQLVTYQFVHDPHGIWHIAFNMLFLWVFGSAVEDRLGRIGFLGFYLTGGVVAALAHAGINRSPVIGASGAIAAVTGAFLALFPRSRIQVFVFFFFIGVWSIRSIWFIGIYILVDLLRQLGTFFGHGGSNVAYAAHLAGYAFGFALGFVLLATNVVKRQEFDVFFLLTQARRRAEFRAASRQGPAGLWASATADSARRLEAGARGRPALDADDERRGALRAQIGRLIADHRLAEAAVLYRDLLAGAPAGEGGLAVLSEQAQLDVASQLFAQEAHADAARAAELFLCSYHSSPRADEVRLMLGVLYARHLDEPARARQLIEEAIPRLRQATQSRLAAELLAELAA